MLDSDPGHGICHALMPGESTDAGHFHARVLEVGAIITTLTPEQKRLIERAGEEPVLVEDPDTHEVYVVIKEEVFRRIQAFLGSEQSDPSLFEFEDFQPLP